MTVYIVKFSGGEYENAFEFILGVYDDLVVAEYEACQRMENMDKRDYIDTCVIEEWKVNFEYVTDVREWWRKADGSFIPSKEWVTGVTEPYDRD